ncbi:MAG TPA: hypothetical protein VMM37_02290 [Bacteroidota bacterium]|nr:hypothetical protein [Bacteroidota bacterium]
MKSRILLAFLGALLIVVSTHAQAQLDTALFAGMKARSIGPAGMGGRIGGIDAVIANPQTIVVGAATGGVWKTTNGGVTWKPLFDNEPVAAIGAVAIFQPSPSILWAGTGEGNPRNSASVGNGIYKSMDGGMTWNHVGLEGTERIHRILLHPTNPDIAYVGAMGRMWGENPERGVYKTSDGGKTWKKVLYVDEKTGCGDLIMDPSNPNKLIAAMWQYRRWPWFFQSGGPGSGIFISYDAGETWKKLGDQEGLPKGDLGRTGVAFAHSNPDVVYALVEAKRNALYRSDDGGRSWRMVNDTRSVNERPFYFADIRVDPQNENRIYSLQTNLNLSTDGGKTFVNITPGNRVHSDHHALWINPLDGNLLMDGNDGGVAISYDRGRTWRFVENLPLGQYYHINVDMEIPYNVFGGMQDNGSWRGPSEVWENSGIRDWHWNEVGFGDGFGTLVDASDPFYGYAMSQSGGLIRFNWKTGERKDIRPWGPDNVELRFNWNAGISSDPFDSKTIYYGSQFVHKSTDRGESWTLVSPDLTTNDPSKQKQDSSGGLTKDVTGAENHTTIMTIAPSPVQRGVIWVGTDDGNVQVTQDGGKTWTNVVDRIPDVPKATWVPQIKASKFDAGTAYVVFDDHRRSNWKTYLFKTEDFGKSWKSLTKNDPTAGSKALWGYGLVLEQDPVKKDLLYFGTEFGLWISFDDGKNWMKWTHGFPTVSTMALMVHPRDNDLVIGTHGRSAYILDDIRPLRTVTKELLEKPVHIFSIPTAYEHQVRAMDGYHFPGDAMYRGENRPYGALITYVVNPSKGQKDTTMEEGVEGAANREETPEQGTMERPGRRNAKTVKIEVLGADGKVIRTFDGPMEKGINRASWNLRRDGFKRPQLTPSTQQEEGFFAPQGPEVLPGKYTIRIKVGKEQAEQTVEVVPDPRVTIPVEARQQKFETIMKVGGHLEVAAEAVDRIQKTRKAIDQVLGQLTGKRDESTRILRKASADLKKALSTVADKFIDDPNAVQGITRRPNTVSGRLGNVLRSLSSSWDAPNPTQLTYLRQAEAILDDALKSYNKVFAEDVASYKEKVDQAKLSAFPETGSLDLNWKPKKKE